MISPPQLPWLTLLPTVPRTLPTLAAAALLAACSSVNPLHDGDRHSYVQEEGLTGPDSAHVVQGRIYQGMPVEHAVAALGPPDRRDTTTTDGQPRVRLTYRARPNAFDPGNLARAYVVAEAGRVAEWENLSLIPRFDAYYEGGM